MILHNLLNTQMIGNMFIKILKKYNLGKERKVLIVFHDMIADVINDKKVNTVVTELFIRNKKLNISIFLVTKTYFKVPKEVRLNTRHFFITKIPNKRELQQIVLNYSSDVDFIGFIKIYKIKSILQNHISFSLIIQLSQLQLHQIIL